MAWTAPSTWVAGAILTAAQLNTQLRDNLLAGGPIYATEALRDAAITSPFEGQRAYITGSTVAAATGTTTAVPTGIQTIYNGTAWVCVTPVGAFSTTSGSITSATYATTLTGDATAISVTLSTGTTARLDMSGLANANTVANAYITYSVSGASTVAASDTNSTFAAVAASTYTVALARSVIISGLTAGTNTFTLNYKISPGTSTATYVSRNLIVSGVA